MACAIIQAHGRGEHPHMSFYGNLQAKAASLIERFGQTVTLVSQSTTEADPVTGETTTTETSYQVSGAVFDKNQIDSGEKYSGQTTVEAEDRICLMSGTPVVPALGDRVVVGSTRYSIVNVKTINPAGVDVLYEVAIR